MTHRYSYLTKTVFLATSIALGGISSGTLGCGGSDGGTPPTVDSDLLGIYQVNQYQGNQEGCDAVSDIDPSQSRVVLYAAPSNDDPDVAFLVGQLCGDADDCREQARDFPTVVNYSFFAGSDEAGWVGPGISSRGQLGDQCLFDVQRHNLTSSIAGAIRIETQTFEVEFAPAGMDGESITCRDTDALAALNDTLPCMEIIILEGTFEVGI